MLLSRLPITPVSGSGSQAGQYTGAWIRLATPCQPAGAAAEQRGAAAGLAAEAFPPQPARAAAARASAIPVQRRVTSPRVQPIHGNPRAVEPIVGLRAKGRPRQLGVERGAA